jgi:hypothetical protein
MEKLVDQGRQLVMVLMDVRMFSTLLIVLSTVPFEEVDTASFQLYSTNRVNAHAPDRVNFLNNDGKKLSYLV